MARLIHPLLWALLSLGISLQTLKGAEAVGSDEQIKNLTNKHLQTIPPRDANSTVTTLLLSGNLIRLNESDRLALVSYSGLTRLYLDNNMVRTIKAKYFTQVQGLQVLSLSGNKISRLDPEAFSGLDGLTQLDLSNNSLTVFPYQLLKSLKNLQLLNVEGNPWNCSCEVLHSLIQAQEDWTFSFAVNATCASPQSMLGMDLTEAIAKCFPTQDISTTKVPTAETTAILKPTAKAQPNGSRSIELPATPSNSWKFTLSVAALGLTTAVLIIFAIKGPSWYQLFHNYRHRRLRDEPPVGTTVFHQTPRHQQTFSFQQEDGNQRTTEEGEEEDEYFEDPYIRRED